jgi:hypothetical protein
MHENGYHYTSQIDPALDIPDRLCGLVLLLHRIVVNLVLGFANARSVSPSERRVIMAPVAPTHCGSMRVIFHRQSLVPQCICLLAKHVCLLSTRPVVFYPPSKQLPSAEQAVASNTREVLKDIKTYK